MSLLFHLADIKTDPIKGKKNKLKKWISLVSTEFKKEVGDINIIFCSNEYLLKINQQFLNHHYYTDVITFSYNENNVLAGDIFISIDQVAANAQQFKASFDEELFRVMIHGILHLIGFDDDTDHKRMHMHVLEDEALEKLNLSK
ncbi:MAG: rRNA maturation RNase YbeY [Bacteroidales bacterium]|nr:rRNA maturation RNase YbeY [Bacteroidales bacterium]